MRKKSTIIFTIAAVIFLGGQAVAGTTWFKKQINVFYRNLTVFVDGEQLDTPVEPFIYQGHTMVPLRVLSEALGKSVTWEEETGRIIIGTAPRSAAAPAKLEDLPVLRNVGPFYDRKGGFVITRRSFADGIAVDLGKDTKQAEVVIELRGKYAKLSGYVGVDDSTQNSKGAYKLTILGDNRQLFGPTEVRPGRYPIGIELGVENMETVTFRVEWFSDGPGDYEDVIAALADFKVW